MQVFLIRHPRPLIDPGICYGRLEVDTAEAQSAASRLRSLLPAQSTLISSPSLRARRLAELLHAQPIYDDRLMEMDFGDWEGKRWSDLDRHVIDAWAADVLHFVPPGGESAAMLQARAIACVSAQHGEALILLTHSGVIRALLGHWLQLPVSEWSQLKVDFAGVTQLEVEVGGGVNAAKATLRYMNI